MVTGNPRGYLCYYTEEFPHYVDNLPEFRTFTRLAKMKLFYE